MSPIAIWPLIQSHKFIIVWNWGIIILIRASPQDLAFTEFLVSSAWQEAEIHWSSLEKWLKRKELAVLQPGCVMLPKEVTKAEKKNNAWRDQVSLYFIRW